MVCEAREPATSTAKRVPRKKASRRQASSSSISTTQSQQNAPAQDSLKVQSHSPTDAFRPPATTKLSSHGGAAERQHFGANSSAVGFAARIFGDSAASHSSDISSIPGQAGRSKRTLIGADSGRPWSLVTMDCPPPAVLDVLVDAYFDRMHWFIVIFHEPSFRRSAQHILTRTLWEQGELGAVLAVLMAAAVGLHGAARDPSWTGHALLSQAGLKPDWLLESLIKEVRFHLLDLLDDCCIETVQVCSLLGAYYMFHASPTLAWSIIGLSVRTAYALSLHCDSDTDNDSGQDHDPIMAQVRRRNWNHITISDTFAAMIYGRPAALDAAFAYVHPLENLDDMKFGPVLSQHPLLSHNASESDSLSSQTVTLQTFHVLKYRLYEIIRQALNRFRVLRLQSPISPEDLESLVQTVQDVRSMIDSWRENLPPVFNCDPDAQDAALEELSKIDGLSPQEQRDRQHLSLQILGLRITYASAVIFVHRPLLEYRVPASSRQAVPRHALEVVAESLRLSVTAALHMSRVPVTRLESQFGMSFVLMNFFTAGVILCIPPTTWPLSTIAHEAKAGTLRIIRASRAINILQQEVDNGLQHELQQEPAALDESQRNGHLGSSYEQKTAQQRSGSAHFPSSYEHDAHTTNRDSYRSSAPDVGRTPQTYFPMSSERSAPPSTAQQQQQQQQQQPNPVLQCHGTETSQDVNLLAPPATSPMFNENYLTSSSSDFRLPTMGDYYSEQRNQVDSQLDEAIGTFGQMLFNLVPNDPYSAWTWGNGGF
ncbi:hypothetical protein QQS21_005113 [Conoideocrella luteorostrata]|uniref:Xylanolytic transcriptional activator regulatory domain-containing protein n=1 Tax=Conoideocrella luteorostrata TaxID=1105319 RepID=A0AAJ0CQ27_9HYPO|nr:hypothetical protein QQS21_005113 [Conoideocrella luteorostrata]